MRLVDWTQSVSNHFFVQRKRVAIIGGGVSGLAAAKAFAQAGHEIVGYEASSQLGGVWDTSKCYSDVKTQSPKDLYRYTDFDYPQDVPEWPNGAQVQAYLQSYADHFDVTAKYCLSTKVLTMTRSLQGGWQVIVQTDNEKPRTEHFDFVAVCSGTYSRPHVPQVNGQGDLGAPIYHSSEIQDPSAQFKDKNVVIIGGSKSATDLAVSASKRGAKSVTMVYRRNVWRVPYYVGGIINFKHLLYMRAQEDQFDGYHRSSSWIVRFFKDWVFRLVIWANFRALELLLILQLGLRALQMIPKERIEDTVSCALPLVTPGLFEGFGNGTINPVQASMDRMSNKQLHLSNGKVLDCDICVMATGWEMDVPFLSKQHQGRLIDPEDGLFRLYRHAVNPDLPGLGFVGLNSSFCTVLTSELAANWLVRHVDGQLTHRVSSKEMHKEIDSFLTWIRTERPALKKYRGACIAPFHFAHLDEWLQDMGSLCKTGNLARDYFTYPRAEDCAAYLATAPQYKVKA